MAISPTHWKKISFSISFLPANQSLSFLRIRATGTVCERDVRCVCDGRGEVRVDYWLQVECNWIAVSSQMREQTREAQNTFLRLIVTHASRQSKGLRPMVLSLKAGGSLKLTWASQTPCHPQESPASPPSSGSVEAVHPHAVCLHLTCLCLPIGDTCGTVNPKSKWSLHRCMTLLLPCNTKEDIILVTLNIKVSFVKVFVNE